MQQHFSQISLLNDDTIASTYPDPLNQFCCYAASGSENIEQQCALAHSNIFVYGKENLYTYPSNFTSFMYVPFHQLFRGRRDNAFCSNNNQTMKKKNNQTWPLSLLFSISPYTLFSSLLFLPILFIWINTETYIPHSFSLKPLLIVWPSSRVLRTLPDLLLVFYNHGDLFNTRYSCPWQATGKTCCWKGVRVVYNQCIFARPVFCLLLLINNLSNLPPFIILMPVVVFVCYICLHPVLKKAVPCKPGRNLQWRPVTLLPVMPFQRFLIIPLWRRYYYLMPVANLVDNDCSVITGVRSQHLRPAAQNNLNRCYYDVCKAQRRRRWYATLIVRLFYAAVPFPT